MHYCCLTSYIYESPLLSLQKTITVSSSKFIFLYLKKVASLFKKIAVLLSILHHG
jgi:hypothetical protein